MSLWLQALDNNALLTQAAIPPAAAPTKSGRWLLNCRILKGSTKLAALSGCPAGQAKR
ncbi:hypothetical protein SORBI_3003G268650 [Sorghum bicolor]|uniref:Uncharacterized protein n=1 Tax=Sorghum bicolor TaxID=4558 RepID=A0A1W0VZ35_SORBI|nr:hypothetical protein SORBI_3003G268650 [Sorghum bicolor]